MRLLFLLILERSVAGRSSPFLLFSPAFPSSMPPVFSLVVRLGPHEARNEPDPVLINGGLVVPNVDLTLSRLRMGWNLGRLEIPAEVFKSGSTQAALRGQEMGLGRMKYFISWLFSISPRVGSLVLFSPGDTCKGCVIPSQSKELSSRLVTRVCQQGGKEYRTCSHIQYPLCRILSHRNMPRFYWH